MKPSCEKGSPSEKPNVVRIDVDVASSSAAVASSMIVCVTYRTCIAVSVALAALRELCTGTVRFSIELLYVALSA